MLLEKPGEMSIASAEAESPIPAAGGSKGDQIDQANADAEAELQIQLHQTDLRLLRAIEDALARIRHGTFGTCEACQHPISRARLEAVPWARLWSKISANKAMVSRGKKARKSTGKSSRASQAEVPFRPQVIEVDDGYATVFVGGLGSRKK